MSLYEKKIRMVTVLSRSFNGEEETVTKEVVLLSDIKDTLKELRKFMNESTISSPRNHNNIDRLKLWDELNKLFGEELLNKLFCEHCSFRCIASDCECKCHYNRRINSRLDLFPKRTIDCEPKPELD
mgnify:CR=1 FL=1